jgi:type I restriction enzyme S subunit
LNVPILRFSEFSGEWGVKRLKNISKEITQTSESDETEVLTISAGKGFISQKERWNKVIAGNSLKKYIFLKKNEFSYNRGNSKTFPYGCIYRLKDHDSALVPNVYRSFSVEKQNPLFYEHLFSGGHIDRQLNKLISSSARMDGLLNISKKDFFNVEVPVPTIQEQKKIGNFLSKINEKIGKIEKKQQLWESYKKGLIQQIFSQKLRFQDENGEDYPRWAEKKLESIMEYGKAGSTPISTIKKYYNGPIPFLSISDMTIHGKYIFSTEKTITEEGLNNSSAWIVPKNSLLYSIYASVGSVAINKLDISTSQAIFGIILKDNIAKTEYVYYYLLYYKRYIRRLIETGTQANLNAKTVRNLIIKLPSINEQARISDFLSSVDIKIDLINKELEINKEFKNGLFQQMFC